MKKILLLLVLFIPTVIEIMAQEEHHKCSVYDIRHRHQSFKVQPQPTVDRSISAEKYVTVDFYVSYNAYVAMGSSASNVYNACTSACATVTGTFHNSSNNGGNLTNALTFCMTALTVGVNVNNSNLPFIIDPASSSNTLDNLAGYTTSTAPPGDLHVFVGTSADLTSAGIAYWIGSNLLGNPDACCCVRTGGSGINTFALGHEINHLIGTSHPSNSGDLPHAIPTPNTFMSAAPFNLIWHNETVNSYQAADFSALSGSPCSNIPLAVELTDFSALKNGKYNDILWETASEVNHMYFLLERSANGVAFQTLDTIDRGGSPYKYTDETPLTVSYYRLRVVEMTNREYFSPIKVVRREKGNFRIFPTLTQGVLTLEWMEEGQGTVQLFDCNGRKVYHFDMEEQRTVSVNMEQLPQGMYWLVVQNDEGIHLEKVIKI